MNIRKKPIESVRIRTDRAEKLKAKSIEITLKIKDLVNEAELINFLIDAEADNIDVTKDGKLFLKRDRS